MNICIDCKKCTNENLCLWVRTLKKYPKGVELDKNNNIKLCPDFERDVPEKNKITQNEFIKQERYKFRVAKYEKELLQFDKIDFYSLCRKEYLNKYTLFKARIKAYAKLINLTYYEVLKRLNLSNKILYPKKLTKLLSDIRKDNTKLKKIEKYKKTILEYDKIEFAILERPAKYNYSNKFKNLIQRYAKLTQQSIFSVINSLQLKNKILKGKDYEK